MTVRTHAIDRMARWMATGLTTAGLTAAILPPVHGGLLPERGQKSTEQSVEVPGAKMPAGTPTIAGSKATLQSVGLRRRPQPTAITVQPSVQTAPPAQPAYPQAAYPQPMYFPAPVQYGAAPAPYGAPAAQVPQQYQQYQEQIASEEGASISRELKKLYEESGREAPQMLNTATGQPQAAPQPQPQFYPPAGYGAPPAGYAQPQGYPAQPGYAPQAGYAPAPGYAPQPGYGQPQGYAAQPGYGPQPGYAAPQGYAPQQAPMAQPRIQQPAASSHPITTQMDGEDPEFFPGEGAVAQQELDGFEFEESVPSHRPIARPQSVPQYHPPVAQYQQPVVQYMPPAPQYQQPVAQQQSPVVQQMPQQLPTLQPIAPQPNQAGYAPAVAPHHMASKPESSGSGFGPSPYAAPQPVAPKPVLPRQEELIAGTPVQTDYEMAADPKGASKKLFGLFGGSATPEHMAPPVEPRPYIPNPAALAADDDLPLAPRSEFNSAPVIDSQELAIEAKFDHSEKLAELPPPPMELEAATIAIKPSVRTVPVHTESTVANAAARGKNYASELFKETEAEKAASAKSVTPPSKPSGIARGFLGPGSNVVPEADAAAAPEPPVTVQIESEKSLDLADSASPRPKVTPRAVEPAAPVAAAEPKEASGLKRANQGLFFPPASMVSPPADVEPAPVVAKKAAPVPAMAEKEPSEPAVAAATQPPARFVERSPYTQSKYEQIASRAGSAGLKGFCPVRLRDHRDLSDGLPAYRAEHNGRTYQMSSAEALSTFLSNPDKYVPVANGYDVVQYGQTGEKVEGSLDNSAWFKGRLFLFASPENKDTFVANPKQFATSKDEAK